LQGVACALWQPLTSLSQLEAIANLQDIFESWRLLAPLSLQPTCLPAPANPGWPIPFPKLGPPPSCPTQL
jgi:hypothetical protein